MAHRDSSPTSHTNWPHYLPSHASWNGSALSQGAMPQLLQKYLRNHNKVIVLLEIMDDDDEEDEAVESVEEP